MIPRHVLALGRGGKLTYGPYITPHGIASAHYCLHTWFLRCFGDSTKKVEPDAGTLMRMRQGNEHETQMVATLEDVERPDVADEWDWEDGEKATLALMKEGHPWIYQGFLVAGDMRGKPDLLMRVDGRSDLGMYSYEPVDIKGHKKVDVRDRLQLGTYGILLEPILGARPKKGKIWLNTGDLDSVNLKKEYKHIEDLAKSMRRLALKKGMTTGYRCGECDRCPWTAVCGKDWDTNKNVCLLPDLTGSQAAKFAAAGYSSWEDVASSSPTDIAKRTGKSEEAAHIIKLHAEARKTGRPQVRLKPAWPSEDTALHFWDIETYGDTVYLHGVIRLCKGSAETKQFFADRPEKEAEAWHAFLDYLARDKKTVVYGWTDFEKKHAEILWQKHHGNKDGWRHIREGLIDQKEFVKEHFALPVTTYSIKKVAPFFGFQWDAEDAGGLNSQTWYDEYLKTADKALLEKLLRYNRDDVEAMRVIHEALRHATKP